MTLGPDLVETLARARADLRMGVPVILTAPAGSWLFAAVETLSPDRLNALRGLGAVDLAITGRRAETLKARAYDGDVARIELPPEADLTWITGVADPADDLRKPMKGPMRTRRDGNATAHRHAIGLCKSARLLPSAIVLGPMASGETPTGLTALPLDDIGPHLIAEPKLRHIIGARVPLRASEDARLHVFRPEDGGEEHYAIEIGRPDRAVPVLSRLHSACFTGDLLGSLKCDCGPQLNAALNHMGQEGAGILLYLNQEGRGIGLANKMRAYSLQDQGFDTVEANHRLGFEDDERDFRLGSALLQALGFDSVRLMTNNPAKIAMMERCGIAVAERVPLKVGENAHNAHYLAVKAAKSGHLL